MHSRIFQVSTEPIKQTDYIDECNYYDHWFTNSIADYVNGNTSRTDDIEWLKLCSRGYAIDSDESGEYLIVKSKENYFQNAYNRFKELLDVVKDCTLQDFSKEIYEMWELKNQYEEKFGFYADFDGDLMTLDSFVRQCKENTKYYIGGTIDYHC